jgi:Asp-tRNA(Asn)/Glu-tRNA(Gln) amidotransferase A subunit family amidase
MNVEDNIAAVKARIAALNPAYRAFSHLAPDAPAVAAALQRELDAGKTRGPLHGLAVSVKGNLPVAGLPWTEGSAIHAGRVAHQDAAIVALARAAGGVVMGTTTLSELAMYGVTNEFEPMGLNPWDVERTAGGSSTGAAVAAALDMAQVNIGSDSGGSIRNPACHCGVVGFMPRIGALALGGGPNHTPSLSSIGLIGRRVAEVQTAFRVLAQVATEATSTRRLLVPRRLIARMCDEETQTLFRAALERLSKVDFEIIEREIPGWTEGERAAGVVSLFESGQALACMDLSRAATGIRARAAAAAKLAAAQVDSARAERAALRQSFSTALRLTQADAVATPTWPFAAPHLEAQSVVVAGTSVPVDPHRNCFVRAANAIDACAISLPMGLYPGAGVPAGLHLTGEGGSEMRLLAVARLIEAALPALPSAPALTMHRKEKSP